MTVHQPLAAGRRMPTNGAEPAPAGGPALRGPAVVALRTTGLLVLATLAILFLLPAMLAAQPTFLG